MIDIKIQQDALILIKEWSCLFLSWKKVGWCENLWWLLEEWGLNSPESGVDESRPLLRAAAEWSRPLVSVDVELYNPLLSWAADESSPLLRAAAEMSSALLRAATSVNEDASNSLVEWAGDTGVDQIRSF